MWPAWDAPRFSRRSKIGPTLGQTVVVKLRATAGAWFVLAPSCPSSLPWNRFWFSFPGVAKLSPHPRQQWTLRARVRWNASCCQKADDLFSVTPRNERPLRGIGGNLPRVASRADLLSWVSLSVGTYSPPYSGGDRGAFCQNSPLTQMPRGGPWAPLNSPPVWGGSIEESFFRSILARNLAKFLCFNRDFEVAPKIGVLPPKVGGSTGGTYFRFRGEWGGALPPYSDRASYVPTWVVPEPDDFIPLPGN